MSYFSRLSDIVTCNLTELLNLSANPRETLGEIIREMEEGLAGAERSTQTAGRNKERLEQELQESQQQIQTWEQQALESLKDGDENTARMALYRKKEASDLQAGLQQQVRVAHATWEGLMTTYRALEARLAEARRKWEELGGAGQVTTSVDHITSTARELRGQEVEQELAELKRLLEKN